MFETFKTHLDLKKEEKELIRKVEIVNKSKKTTSLKACVKDMRTLASSRKKITIRE